MADDRKAALDAALKKIEKNYGKGAIMKLGEKVDQQISTIPSGSLALDVALGVGGYPRGRIVEVYGPESSGKTTVALHAIAEVQKNGGTAAFIDAEHALDPQYAQKLGVNIDDLLLSQPDTGEQGLEIADALVSSGAVDIVVIDSVAALVPRAEIDGEMGDTHVGFASSFDVTSITETFWFHQQNENDRDLYQPNSRKSWDHVWESRNDTWWTCVEILFNHPFGSTSC